MLRTSVDSPENATIVTPADDLEKHSSDEEIKNDLNSPDPNDAFPDGGLKAWLIVCGVRRYSFPVCIVVI